MILEKGDDSLLCFRQDTRVWNATKCYNSGLEVRGETTRGFNPVISIKPNVT